MIKLDIQSEPLPHDREVIVVMSLSGPIHLSGCKSERKSEGTMDRGAPVSVTVSGITKGMCR